MNDNAPVVDLNGPSQPFTNHSVSLNYSFFEQLDVSIAASDATITDRDEDGRIVSLVVSLESGRPLDRLVLTLCPDSNDSTCYLR